uniref:Uncharacterized protein n=1 Tax=Anguilla anguilla TaxID=7936 RepID=A0A0E9URY8_ANGAN
MRAVVQRRPSSAGQFI